MSMTKIQLLNHAHYGGFYVYHGEYSLSKLFSKFTHSLIKPISTGNIEVCFDESCRNKLILKRDDSYRDKQLEYFLVFCNKYIENIPLLLVVGFKTDSKVKKKYCKLLDFHSLNGEKEISLLDNYEGEDKILQTLINENDRLTDLLTYDIGKRKGDYGNNNNQYNGNKIKIEEDLTSEPNISGSQFKRYIHTPYESGADKKGCVILDKILIYGKNKGLIDIQNRKYQHINVYCSNNVSEPLLLELIENKHNRKKNQYYYYTREKDGSLYWEEIRKGGKVFDIDFDSKSDIFTQLISNSNDKLLKLLNKLTYHLQKTLFVMFNQKSEYSYTNVTESLLLSSIDDSKYRLLNKRIPIKVVDRTNDLLKCINKYDYKVYEHDFTETVKGVNHEKEKVEIKLIRSFPKKNILTINLDKQLNTSYSSGSYEITVSQNSNYNYKYSWYRHSLEGLNFIKKFQVQFKGQYVTFKSENVISHLNYKLIFVYFNIDIPDSFVLLVFTSNDQDKIWYLPYDEFKKSVATGKEIELSSLSSKTASTKSENVGSVFGYLGSRSDRSIDTPLKNLLDEQIKKDYTLRIEINNMNGSNYKSKSVVITVDLNLMTNIYGYKCFIYKFNSHVNTFEIVFHQNYYTKTLDITGEFIDGITSVSIYYQSTNLNIPLIICVSSYKNVDKYFTYWQFVSNLSNSVKLSELSSINEKYLEFKLNDQFQKLQKVVTLKIFETEDYDTQSGKIAVKVVKGHHFDDYKFYTHIPKDPFKHIEIDQNGFTIEGFNGESYTYNKFLYVDVYYHQSDEHNKCPLLLWFYTKSVNFMEEKIDISNTLYKLHKIENDLNIKIYQETRSREKISYVLNSILNGDLKPQINDILDSRKYSNFGQISLYSNESDESIETLYYNHGKNSLYLFFYGDDPRPLVLCHGTQSYKRHYLDRSTSKWINVPGVNSCLCDTNQIDQKLLSALDGITKPLCSLKEERTFEIKDSEIAVVIDLSKKDATYGDSKNIKGSAKRKYIECNLFDYYTHSLTTNSTFKITSIITDQSGTKTINMNTPVPNVMSVNVYFNIYASNMPVLLEIILNNQKKKYLKDLNGSKLTYDTTSLGEIIENQIVDELISESDRINNRITYQIDKMVPYNGIGVIKRPQYGSGYTIYTHSKNVSSNNQSNLLYRQKLLDGKKNNRTEALSEIQGNRLKEISVYCLDSTKNLPILILIKVSNYNSCILKRDQSGFYWKLDQFLHKTHSTTKDKLDEIYYHLMNSLILKMSEIYQSDKRNDYEVKLIDNMAISDRRGHKITDYSNATITNPVKSIQVTDVTNSYPDLIFSSFKCYQHKLPELGGTSEINDIFGLRFFIKNYGTMNYFEIELYERNSNSNNDRKFFYYRPKKNIVTGSTQTTNITVFFHKNDPRPLLLRHDNKGYKRIKNQNDIQWCHDSKILFSNNELHSNLNEIYNGLKKNITFGKNNNIDNINQNKNQRFGSFQKVSYTPKSSFKNQENFNLSKNLLVDQQSIINSNLDKLLNELDGRLFDQINVYKKIKSSSLKDFLLFEFINDSQKIYFGRLDKDGIYWVKQHISESISSELTKIQSESDNAAIYEIDKKSNTANDNTINVLLEPDHSQLGYSKYTHSLTAKFINKTIVHYNCEKLLEKNNTRFQTIVEINSFKYSKISVHFGRSAKSSVLTSQNEIPLMIELTKGDQTNELYYYIHMCDPFYKRYYWKRLPGTEGKILGDLLTDIGLSTSSSKGGYDQLKKMLQKTQFTQGSENDLSDKLKRATGSKIQSLLKLNVNGDESQKPTVLELLLKRIEFNIVDSVVILLDKTDSISQYGDSEVNSVVGKLEPQREINRIGVNNGKSINVKDITDSKGQCLQKYGYKIVCHYIKDAIGDLGQPGKSAVGIRFILPTKAHEKYSLVTFYDGDKTEPDNIEYIYYNNSHYEVCVYFYGQDPRPLLLSYAGKTYKPKDRDHYPNVWVKVKDLNSSACQSNSKNPEFLNTLLDVTGFLNPVELNPKKLPNPSDITMTSKTPQNIPYNLHQYRYGNNVNMRIISSSTYCYRKYSYESDGTSANGGGFRLGSIFYTSENNKKGNISYTTTSTHKYEPLSKVVCYYYKKDSNYENPLLVILEFKSGEKEYYQLNNTGISYSWDLLSNEKVDKEYKLYKELFDLNKKFNGDKDPKEEDCIPSDNTAAIAGGTAGGLVGCAAIVGGGVIVLKKLGLIGVTTVAAAL